MLEGFFFVVQTLFDCRSFETENGPIFVKINGKHGVGNLAHDLIFHFQAETMFRGEYASLRAIMATNAIKCPKPLGFFSTKSGDWALVMEYIKMGGSRDEKKLARSLAKYFSILVETAPF